MTNRYSNHSGFKYLVLLDRNIISFISESNEKREPRNREIRQILKKLRAYDTKSHKITILTSLIEGSKGNLESISESNETVNEEIQILKKFFNRAYIDLSLSESPLKELFGLIKGNGLLKNLNDKENFLKSIAHLLFNTPKKQRKDIAKHIISEGKKYSSFNEFHPIVFCSLLCLYGNKFAGKILKPNKGSYYNQVMDFMHIYFYLKTKYILGNLYGLKVKFLSYDKSLNELMSYYDLDNYTLIQYGVYDSFSISLSDKGKLILPKELLNLLYNS